MKKNPWKPISTADLNSMKQVDLWLDIPASPRSFGMADAFRVVDCWHHNGKWVHSHRGETKELRQYVITHWMPIPPEPKPLATPKKK